MAEKKMLATPEAHYALNCKISENILQAEFEAQDRKSERFRRKMDREIFHARQGLADIKARTPSPRSASCQQAEEEFALVDDPDSNLLAFKTKRNLVMSKRISSSLEVMREQRENSPSNRSRDSPYGQALSVSPKAVQDLQKAATVLKNTRHEAEVLKLLNTVQPASPRSPRS
ncbi:hypothetical protein PoB_002429500 [Plakobranchus ocellatus]|uniref:Uncharacterized protein n=1 Tax=Plakobranchus ocellatus TaxID=259542 RepID=A0AAV3ZPZ4_9GAST|nr:hypothetical protein PoB_002429500 [Plakobranchus ocellatus]